MKSPLKKTILSILLLLILVAACVPTETLPREDKLATIVAKTLTARPTDFTQIPTLTETPIPTIANLSTPESALPTVATANGPVFVRTIVQNANQGIVAKGHRLVTGIAQ